MSIIAPGTFEALGIPLMSGRDFDHGDTRDRPLVAIVNEALVRKSFGRQDPIGRRIHCLFDRSDPMTIVGVVGDVRQRNPAIEPTAECYMPYQQHSYNSNTLNVVIRTAGNPLDVAPTVRRVAADVSREVPVSFTTMDAMVSDSVAESRFRALLFGLFAGVAVCLAMAGVYGVMAFTVAQRSREIGVRVALGATRLSVVRSVLGHGLGVATCGLAVGLAIAAVASRLVEAMLFDVRRFDIPVYGGVSALVAVITLIAGFVPSWRAAMVNPGDILKTE
jgi:predicted permease